MPHIDGIEMLRHRSGFRRRTVLLLPRYLHEADLLADIRGDSPLGNIHVVFLQIASACSVGLGSGALMYLDYSQSFSSDQYHIPIKAV